MSQSLDELNERVKQTSTWVNTLRTEVARVIVGQHYLVDRLLVLVVPALVVQMQMVGI